MTIAPADQQMRLLDCAPRFNISSNATARNAYGQAAQEIVCAALQLTPVRINGRYEVCFDALRSDDTHFEIKSCYRSSKVVIYDWRAKKEAKAGVHVNYAILLHKAKGIRDGDNLFGFLNDSKLELLVLPAVIVHACAAREPLNRISTTVIPNSGGQRNGYQRNGYKEGYRNVPVRVLREYAMPKPYVRRFSLHGVDFEVAVYSSMLA